MMRAFGTMLSLILASTATAAGDASSGDFAVTETSSLQGSPALAADANAGRFLVTWTDARNVVSGLDIYGRIIGSDGGPVSPEFPVVRAGGDQAFAALAFDRNRDRFLVVWSDWREARTTDSDIYGRFIGADGIPVGEAFPIVRERVSQKFPAVSFDPANDRYLVVWTEKRGDGTADRIRGRLLGPDAGFVGSQFTLANQGGDQLRPSVVLDSNRARFLVLWWDGDNTTISAALVDANTSEVSPPITLVGGRDPQPEARYAAAYAPTDDMFLVAWSSKGDPARQGSDIKAALVEGTTARPKGAAISIATGDGSHQAATVCYDSGSRRFLVVWLERRWNGDATEMNILGRFVSAFGILSGRFPISGPPVRGRKRSPVAAYSPADGSFLILWEDERPGSGSRRKIYGRVR